LLRELPPAPADRGALQERRSCPLLIVGAEKDNTVPASLSKKQYEKYQKSDARTDYIEFQGRPHLMMVAEGWEEIAAGIENWLDGVLAASAVGREGASA
jgi:alpha-beta hydrolase superfamily lysophospholipase